MARTVLLGDPSFFRVKSGSNPHTRDGLGRRKRVDLSSAIAQWGDLKSALEQNGLRVRVIPPDPELPGLVFPANAGFRFGSRFYLSNLNPARAAEKQHYRRAVSALGLAVQDLPGDTPFEGEADFIPVGHPSGDPARAVYLFTTGRIEQPRWVFRAGFPPYRRVYGFRSDCRALPALRSIVQPLEVMLLELVDERHYHGDTVLCTFGPRNEYLMASLDGLAPESARSLQARFGDRLLPLESQDGRCFAANSFQVMAERYGEQVPVLLMPDGLSLEVYEQVRARGVIPFPLDVSEFLQKGGGAVKCMLLDLGDL